MRTISLRVAVPRKSDNTNDRLFGESFSWTDEFRRLLTESFAHCVTVFLILKTRSTPRVRIKLRNQSQGTGVKKSALCVKVFVIDMKIRRERTCRHQHNIVYQLHWIFKEWVTNIHCFMGVRRISVIVKTPMTSKVPSLQNWTFFM